jgi:hypothetical protein
VLIRLDSGLYVLLAHLRQHGLKVVDGERVYPGQPVGHCGNTGRSPQPHLHLHVQTSAVLGSPTQPFHLLSVALHAALQPSADFRLACRPDEGTHVGIIKEDAALRRALHLPVGLQLHYRYRHDDGDWASQCLTVTLDLTGGFRLGSDSGASVRFAEEGGVLFFFERSPEPDPLLDLWLLALGLTPLAEAPLAWQDRPADRLLPLSRQWRVLRALLRPLGGGLDSRYQRSKEDGSWRQQGRHRLSLMPGLSCDAQSEAEVSAHYGVTRLSLRSDQGLLQADLGYALSSYHGNLALHQFTPTVGFGFNEQYDWVQLRGYIIHSSNSQRTEGKTNTYSLEGKWFHYFKPGALLGLDRVQATVLAGKRIFAVDGDAGAVYNLADMQKGSLSLGANWKLGGGWAILAIGGYERYEDGDIDDDYDNRFVYLDLSKSW